MREHEQFENAGGKLDSINKNFTECKDKLRSLRNDYHAEDKRLKEQHEEVQILKERNLKIKEYIREKKKIESETGMKQNVTQDEIDEVEAKLTSLESSKKDTEKQWKQRLQLQDDRVKRIQHESNQLELKLKEKENEYRMINLKIKELKRTIQGTYVAKASARTRRKKSARSESKYGKKPTNKADAVSLHFRSFLNYQFI